MKWIALAFALIATPVLAATIEQLDAAKSALIEKEGADAVVAAEATDVESINIRVDVKVPEGERNQRSTDVVILPTDPEFADVLAAAKAAYARKAAAETQKMEDSGVTVAPEVK